LINDGSSKPGVRASVINDGMGRFHLILTGVDSGAANQIEIKQSTMQHMDISEFSVTRQATNALIKLDGFPPDPDTWIQSASNLVTDIIPGASVRLRDVGTANFTITNDDNAMADKIQAFVDEFNALLEFIDEITRVVLDENNEAVTDASGVLVGNYGVNMLRGIMRNFIAMRATGFHQDHNLLFLLPQVGVRSPSRYLGMGVTGADRNLGNRGIEFDRDLFREVLNRNPNDVISLWTADRQPAISNSNFNFISGTSTTQAGIYRFTVRRDDENSVPMIEYHCSVTNQTFSSENGDIIYGNGTFTIINGGARGAAIQIAGNLGPGATETNFTLQIKDGQAKTFNAELERLFHPETGITNIIKNNYESIIRTLEQRIDRENQRVLQVQRRLEMRFSRLEVNMSIWNGQMDRVQAQVSSLPTSW
jgi:flagellar hook-associated protein 2